MSEMTDAEFHAQLDELASRARQHMVVGPTLEEELEELVERARRAAAGVELETEPPPESIWTHGEFYVRERRLWDADAALTASARRPALPPLPRRVRWDASRPHQVLTASGRPVPGWTPAQVLRLHELGVTAARLRRAGKPSLQASAGTRLPMSGGSKSAAEAALDAVRALVKVLDASRPR